MYFSFTVLLFVLFCVSFASDDMPDATCQRGISVGSACCALSCGSCGGPLCGSFPGGGGACCSGPIVSGSRGCNSVGPPCKLGVASSAGEASEQEAGDGSVWKNIDDRVQGRPQARHEACFVMVRGKGYLIGGRGERRVSIFVPKLGKWINGPDMPTQMHHMQCVGWRGSVYVAASWFGGFPNEENNAEMWVLDTSTLTWESRPGLPEERRRGGAAVVVFRKKLYVVAGNTGGHGPPSKAVGWMDYYDLVEKKWVLNLADMPDARDHVGGAMVNGRLCIAGGRDGGQRDFFAAVRLDTYCYNFAGEKWINVNAALPAGRAGAATARICGNKMMVAGGEWKFREAFSDVDIFDGKKWTKSARLVRERHGTGLGVAKCSCGQVFIASGSGAKGGSPELDSTEVYLPKGNDTKCERY